MAKVLRQKNHKINIQIHFVRIDLPKEVSVTMGQESDGLIKESELLLFLICF